MLAVDTNVVVRFLTDDDAAQHRRAVALFRKHAVWLPKTVMLEAEWVLRSAFQFEAGEIAEAFNALLGLPDVRCEDAPAVHAAIEALGQGLDFADALHLMSARGAGAAGGFATFDARFVKRARKQWPDAMVITP